MVIDLFQETKRKKGKKIIKKHVFLNLINELCMGPAPKLLDKLRLIWFSVYVPTEKQSAVVRIAVKTRREKHDMNKPAYLELSSQQYKLAEPIE